MLLSVIIPTRNRAYFLNSTLESLVKQSFPVDLFEVIVVDNGSTDETEKVCDRFKHRFNSFVYLYEESPGLHVGRHAGLKAAQSDILVYTDDDIEAFPSLLEAIHECFSDGGVAMVGGKCLPKFESDPPEWLLKMWDQKNDGNRILGYYSLMDLGNEKKEISPFHIYGCNFSIRKRILLEAGGFHPDGMPDDMLCFRGDGETHVSKYVKEKGYRALYHPDASVYHVVSRNRMTIEYVCKRAYMQGISDSYSLIRDYGLSFSVRIMLKRWKDMIRQLGNNSIEVKIRNFCWAGFQFHQKEVRKDITLLDWIAKPDYF